MQRVELPSCILRLSAIAQPWQKLVYRNNY